MKVGIKKLSNILFLYFATQINSTISKHFEKAKGPVFTGTDEEASEFLSSVANLDGMKKFIESGGNPNLKILGTYVRPILFYHNFEQQIESIIYLIEHGANVNSQNVSGCSVLHTLFGAISLKNILRINKQQIFNLIQFLKNHNLDFNLTMSNGDTSLHILTCWISTDVQCDVAIELIKNGADYNIKNKYEKSAKDIAFGRITGFKSNDQKIDYLKCGGVPWKLLNFFHYKDELPKKIKEGLSDVLPADLHPIVTAYTSNDMDINHKHYNEEDFLKDDSYDE